jgi:low temperature requirement protein LtrA
MVQSVIIYSDVIPTVLGIISIFFMGSGVMDHKNSYLILGVVLFLLAVIVPWVIISSII